MAEKINCPTPSKANRDVCSVLVATTALAVAIPCSKSSLLSLAMARYHEEYLVQHPRACTKSYLASYETEKPGPTCCFSYSNENS